MKNKKELINKLLMEQMKVLSHIDHNSDLILKKSYLKLLFHKQVELNKLKALEMSKKISLACYSLMQYQNNDISLDEILVILKDCLTTNFCHSYSISATWNINQIYQILKKDQIIKQTV